MDPDAKSKIDSTLARLSALAGPDDYQQGFPEEDDPPAPATLKSATGFGSKYSRLWDRPTDPGWQKTLAKLLAVVKSGGIAAMIGSRGTGKTRLAAEAARETSPDLARYETAMQLFLRLRASFRPDSPESEKSIVDALVGCPLLVLDEIQERGGSEWEDRILTHIIDRRYAREKPTILIANLKPEETIAHLGESIVDRIRESGGIIRVEGRSHRAKPDPNGTKRPESANLPPSIPAMPSESPGRVETAERP